MNSKLLIAIGIVGLIIVGIVVFSFNKKSTPSTTSDTTQTQQTQESPGESMAEYIKAFEGNGSVKCTYNYEGTTGLTYIKNGKVRFEATANGTTSNSIMVDKVVYSWQSGQKTGMMMDTSKLTASVTPGEPQQYKSPDDIKKDLQTYKPQCVSENIPDSMFEKPADVTFTDISKMMQDVKSKIPANVTIPQGFEIPQQ